MKRYTKTLITEETNLGNLIEEALKNIQKEDAASDTNEDGVNISDEDIFEELEEQIHDDDFEQYSDFLDNEAADDASLLEFLSKEGVK